MDILVCLGPIIGAVIIVGYFIILKIYYIAKNLETTKKSHKNIYKILIAVEAILLLNTIFLPKITGRDYLINGMLTGSVYTISQDTFKVSYMSAKRGFSDTLKLKRSQLENIQAVCLADEGKVYLNITQNNTENKIDITNKTVILDMKEYDEGYITFTLLNENAKNVKFELKF